MGIWYTPPPTFIGGPQPYEPRRNVPPSDGDRPFPPKPWWPAWYAWQVSDPLPTLQKKFTLPVGDQPPTISSPWWPIWWKGLPPDPLPTLQIRFPFVPGDQPPTISAPWWPDYWAWILKEVPRVIPPPVMTPPVEGVQPPEPPVVPVVVERPGGDSARVRLRRRPLYYWEAAALKRLSRREIEDSLVEELAYAEATIPKSLDDFEERVSHLREIAKRLDAIRAYHELAKRVRSVIERFEETRIKQLADQDEENEINDLIQFL